MIGVATVLILASVGLALLMTGERGPYALLHRIRHACGVREYTDGGKTYLKTPTELSKLAACPKCQVVWWGVIASAAYTLIGEQVVVCALPFAAYAVVHALLAKEMDE